MALSNLLPDSMSGPIYLVYLTPRAVGLVVHLLVKFYCIAQHAATAIDILRTITEPPPCQAVPYGKTGS